MRKVFVAALREYRTTALTRSFFFGAVVFPIAIWGIMIAVAAFTKGERPPLTGSMAVVDPTPAGAIAEGIRARFDPQKLEAERQRRIKEIDAALDKSPVPLSPQQREIAKSQALAFFGLAKAWQVDVQTATPAEADAWREKVKTGAALALVEISEASVAVPPGAFQLFNTRKMDPDDLSAIREAATRSIVDERLRRASLDPVRVRDIMAAPPQAATATLTAEGVQKGGEALARILPFAFMFLLYLSAVIGGSYLLYSTLEEKSNRIMEVLLSAMSPTQLLAGKILGQGAVGLTVLIMYAGLGLLAARHFGVLHQIPLGALPWMLVFFLIAYAFQAALTAAVGSACAQITDAQALYAPVTMINILPFLVMVPVMENPGGLLPKVLTLTPVISPYVAIMRLGQPAHPVPLWELFAATLVGIAAVIAAVWLAAKIFRVGVLMYGKPPSILGLLKWASYR
ncbi:MAG: ABC transporter permease [Phycisphaerales bacterium]|nr:ABC transporter permease [Phycisphaerales bacterium]